jgi:hypothetical protein
MPLRDHFHPPLTDRFSWSELHGMWPGEMVRHLKKILPPGFRAAPKIHLGSPFEVDVSALDERPYGERTAWNGTATLTAPAPTLTVEAELPDEDEYETRIYEEDDTGRTLVAAIEIVSPSNKDRPRSRRTFVKKVAELLQEDVCVAIVDLVTNRHPNLYAELLDRLECSDPSLGDPPPGLYAVSMRARKTDRRPALLEAWFHPLTLGQPLPKLPIWLTPERHIELDLEPSYEEACGVLDIA